MTQTYTWEIWDGNEYKSGTVKAKSEAHAKRLARKATGIKWDKRWHKGWNSKAINNGLASWIPDNNNPPNLYLWLYIAKETT